MIASISGTVQDVRARSAVINVQGVGFAILATPDTLSRLHVGHETFLYTSLVVKDDSLTLFGFNDADEKETFEILQTVSGIGARTALAILSVFPPDELRRALADKDERALTRVPGIGKKGAQRMILEIGDKLGTFSSHQDRSYDQSAPSSERSDVLEALINLGWQEKLASEALATAEEQAGSDQLTVPQLLRSALQILGKMR